jgi:apolipoprotein N-acyltransferase
VRLSGTSGEAGGSAETGIDGGQARPAAAGHTDHRRLAGSGSAAEARPAAAGHTAASDRSAGVRAAPDPGRPGDSGVRTRVAVLLAIVGGLALAAAFPPVGAWPLAAAGPALLAVALWRRSLRGAALIGLVFGLSFFVPLLSWLVNVAWYAWAALAVAEAIVFAVLAVGQRLLLRLRAWPLAVAGWWVAAEAVRDRWPWAFPWGRLAMSQAEAPTARWVAIGGPPLLTFLVALTGAALAWLLLTRPTIGPAAGPASREARPDAQPAARSAASRQRHRRLVPAAAFVLAAGVALAGRALPVDQGGAGAPTSEVAAVQGNVPHKGTLQKQLQETTVTQNHAAATDSLAAQVRAGLRASPAVVIWPENSTDIDPGLDPATYASIASAVAAIGRPVLVGAVLQDPKRNVGQLWLPGRGPVAIYVKRQLVPFGEVIPFRGFLSEFTSLPSLVPTNFTPGHRAVVFRIGKIRLGDVICYEVGFDNLVSSEVTGGANLLTVQTNDADFELDGQLGETLQQLAMARIRAIEYDRAVVVASTTGVSAVIAPDGSLLAHSTTWRRAVLEARVQLRSDRTLAERLGGWPEIVISGLTLAALAMVLGGGIATRYRGARP